MINLDMPLYGRAFQHTDDMKKPFHDVGEDSFERGIWNYKVLPHAGAVEQMNQQMRASYCWDEEKSLIISYDTIAISNMKVDYI